MVGQAPWLTDGDLSIFESGAIQLHLGAKSEALMPADPRGRAARAYVGRATARPGFVKAHADQMAHFAAAD